jgi:uncharacterized membrane protein YccC
MADIAAAPTKTAHPLIALWRVVKRMDQAKINDWWMALRNSLAVAIPLAVGIEMGNPLGAVAIAIGALNVSYSDGRDPYFQRARRMLLWSFLCASAVFVGSVTGQFHTGAVLTAAAWAFAAGMMLAMGSQAGDLGTNTLVTVVVFAARGSSTPTGALYSSLLVLGGGLLQTAMALLFWPLRGNKPQLLAVGQAFRDLASEVDPDPDTLKFVAIRTPSVQVQDTLTALGRDHSIAGERFRLLFDQADRLRLSIYLVKRLRDELGEDDSQRDEAEGDAADDLDQFLKGTSRLLAGVGDVLVTGSASPDFEALRARLIELVDRAQARKHNSEMKLGEKIAAALDVLVGQLRLVVQLAKNTTGQGEREFLDSTHAKPWKLQTANWRATIRANLTWNSPVFRHAVRLSVCVTLADIIERGISWHRAYWLPMTVAVVLKPDFTTTFSRGALRLAGTIAGLILATVVYILLPENGWTQLLVVGVFTFFLRYLGPANYGVFTVAVSGLIVFLLAATGVSPAEVIVARALNTVAGGLLALGAYAAWPTWERSTISDSLAEMLEATRIYFRAVAAQVSAKHADDTNAIDNERTRWRLKRSAAEAAVDRVTSEPGNTRVKADCLHSIMASSHSLIHSVMGLEAGMVQSEQKTAPEAFGVFANDVDFTLYFLSSALRGSPFANKNLPQLREDHRRLLESRNALSPLDEYIVLETDRLTVSLNTLREQVVRYLSGC